MPALSVVAKSAVIAPAIAIVRTPRIRTDHALTASSIDRPAAANAIAISSSVPHPNAVMPIGPTGNGSLPDHTVGANAVTRCAVMLRSHHSVLTTFSA